MTRAKSAAPWAVAGVVLAASAFVGVIIAARALTPADNLTFLVFWSILFSVTGTLSGMQGEMARATLPANPAAPQVSGPRALPAGLAIGVGGALITGLALLFILPPVFSDAALPVLALLVVSTIAYAGQSAAVGVLTGRGDGVGASTIVATEGATRLIAMLVAASLSLGFTWLALAAATPMIAWLGVLVATGRWRAVWAARADVPRTDFLRNCILAVGAGALTSLLVNGYPAALRLLSTETVGLAPAIVAVILTRAPLLLPLLTFQGAIVALLARGNAISTNLIRLLGVLVLVASAGAFAFWLVGPWLLQTLYGQAYRLDGLLLALLTLAAGCTAVLVATGAAALAAGRHGWYLAAWAIGTFATFALLLTPLPLATRLVLSLSLGPLLGACAAALGVATANPRPSPSIG